MAVDETEVKPVALLQNQMSLLVSNLQPILLGSLLPVFFGSLVRDPVNTLIALVPTVAIIQAVYCVFCLPSSGHPAPTKLKPGQKSQSKQKTDLGAQLVVTTSHAVFQATMLIQFLHSLPSFPSS
jgi:phosphatidylinositol glycan class F